MSGLTAEERRAMEKAAQASIEFREGLPDRPVPPKLRQDGIIPRLRTPLSDRGMPAEEVIKALVEDTADGLSGMASANFHGYVLGASHPVGVAADMLVSAWGQNSGSSYETPATAGIERALGDWSLDLLGLPANCGVGVVTGATVANVQGVLAGRHMLLAAQGWDVEDKGLFGAPEIPVLIGAEAHSAPFAALRYAGFGAGRAVRVATDDQCRIRTDAFAAALADCKAPPLVILQGGQINSGAFDPFAELIPMVHDAGGWVHVDGAFGLWLAAVPELRDRLAGVELADSWAVDLHKWLNAPFDAALSIVRDRAALVASMSALGAYLPDTSENWEPYESTIELSRRARGVPSYAILRHLGRDGLRALVANHCRLAQKIGDRLDAEPGITVLNEVACNQVAVAFGTGEAGDTQTREVLRVVQENGRVYPSHGDWRGRSILRISVISYATDDEDMDLLADEILLAWKQVQEKE